MEAPALQPLANAVGPARPPSAGAAPGDALRQEGAGGGALRPPGKRAFELQFK